MAAVEKKYVDKVPQNEVRQWKKRHTKKLRKLRITSRQKLEEKGVDVNSFYDGYIQGIEDLLRSIRQEKIAGGEVGGKIN